MEFAPWCAPSTLGWKQAWAINDPFRLLVSNSRTVAAKATANRLPLGKSTNPGLLEPAYRGHLVLSALSSRANSPEGTAERKWGFLRPCRTSDRPAALDSLGSLAA